MGLFRLCCSLVILMSAALAPGGAFAQQRGDPIGPLTRVATFDRAQQVNVGKMRSGKTACYYREEGGSHMLDIGMSADGAFIRLETFDPRDNTPAAPLRLFAGKQIARGQYATNEFTVLKAYDGAFDYYIPNPAQGGFVVLAKGDARSFFEMVARARMEFVVVQSAADRNNTDIVAIYKFTASAIPALLACAKERIQ